MVFLNILKESFLFAVSALKVNRLRTLLTLLGITIGIFAIISVFTVLDCHRWEMMSFTFKNGPGHHLPEKNMPGGNI